MASSADNEKFKNLFCGSWNYDRDENYEAFLAAYDPSEAEKKLGELKPNITYSINGSEITCTYEAGENKISISLPLEGESVFNPSPEMHSKTRSQMKGNIFHQDIDNVKHNKQSTVDVVRVGDELVFTSTYNGVSTKRFYKKA